jgi:putative transposase
VAFNTGHVSFNGEALTFRGVGYETMHLRDFLKPGVKIGAVGHLSPSKLAKTDMAKPVLDAGWSRFTHMLAHKAITHDGMRLEVNEAYTTCCGCGARSAPQGIAGLRITEWSCNVCGAVDSRDSNSGKTILHAGLCTLIGGAHG